MQQYLDKLDSILTKLFAKYRSIGVEPGVLLSGGIDSSTITQLISTYYDEYHIFSMGTPNTKDRPFIEVMSKHLNHPYEWVELTESEIQSHLITSKELLKKAGVEQSLMQVSLATGYYLLFQKAAERGVTHIFTGQGPDITFGGYHKYKSITNINEEIKKDLVLLETDKKRDGAMAKHFGITLINPYLESEMIDFALSVPSEFKIHGGVEKYILRNFAKQIGVPEEIVKRPKKAFQYSTGIQSLISKINSFKI